MFTSTVDSLMNTILSNIAITSLLSVMALLYPVEAQSTMQMESLAERKTETRTDNDVSTASHLRFIAIGDMPYSAVEQAQLNGEIKAAITHSGVPFVTHYGDFKGGSVSCTAELFTEHRDDIYALLPGRVFYTPGDNDWTDCDRAFLENPVSELASLALVRSLFFLPPMNLPDRWAYARQPNFPENARWVYNNVFFVTIHQVGTNNGRQEILKDDIGLALTLVEERDQANQAWLAEAFQAANRANASAMVVITQADVTRSAGRPPCTSTEPINCDAFGVFRADLIRHASQFRTEQTPQKPVLLIHGDTKPYCLDHSMGGKIAPNLWRLNAWGDFKRPADATEVTIVPHHETTPFVAQTLLNHQAPANGCNQ